jgi:membrane associated rhomboid family serine protease
VLLLIFLYQTTLPLPQQELFLLRWAAVPMEITTATDLDPRVPFPIVLTLVTSIFLHADLLHFSGNVLLLLLVAPSVERVLGAWASLGVFLVGGTLGALAQAWATPASLTNLVGASGAIAALIGAGLVIGCLPQYSRLVVFGWMGMQLAGLIDARVDLTGVTGGIAFWSHAVGLMCGIVVAALWRWHARRINPKIPPC